MTILCTADLRFSLRPEATGLTAKLRLVYISVRTFLGAEVKGSDGFCNIDLYTTKTLYFVDNAISLGAATVT